MRLTAASILLAIVISACSPEITAPPGASDAGTAEPTVVPLCEAEIETHDCRWGNDDEVSWQSCAVPVSAPTDTYCLSHTVNIDREPTTRYVNWPRAGIENATITLALTNDSCCYTYPRPERETLEHDISPPKRLETYVFVGDPAPSDQGTSFMLVEGFTTYNGTTITLKFLALSAVYPNALGQNYEYLVENSASPFAFTWDFPEEPILEGIAEDSGLGDYPLDFGPGQSAFGFSSTFDALPVLGSPTFTILGPTGDSLITLTSLAFRPSPD